MSLTATCSWCETSEDFDTPEQADDAGFFLFTPTDRDGREYGEPRAFCSVECVIAAL